MTTTTERGLALRSRPWPEQMRGLLRWAQLAPSTHNSQPWRVRIGEVGAADGDHGFVDVLPDPRRLTPVVDPAGRELAVSCGAFVFHLRVAAAHHGFVTRVQLLPDEHVYARVSFFDEAFDETAGGDREVAAMFPAMALRRTYRLPFRAGVDDAVLAAVVDAADREGARLVVIDDEPHRLRLAHLVSEADRRQWATPAFRAEMAAWCRAPDDERRDGLPGSAVGFGEVASRIAPMVVRTFDLGASRAAQDDELCRGSPVLALLVTDADDRVAWLTAGQSLDRLLLVAAARGWAASVLNQCVEVPELRKELALLAGACAVPQIVLRLGRPHGALPPPTPRRPVEEIVVS